MLGRPRGSFEASIVRARSALRGYGGGGDHLPRHDRKARSTSLSQACSLEASEDGIGCSGIVQRQAEWSVRFNPCTGVCFPW
jgi:hypothetical protein